MRKKRLIKEIDITIRRDGRDTVHTLLFDDGDNDLTEDEMRDFGFCGDIILENDDGTETKLSLIAGNPEYEHGDTVVDGIAFNLYPMCQYEKTVDFAKVVGIKPVYED